MFVGVEDHFAFSRLERNRDDLALEAAFGDGLGSTHLRFQGKGVLCFTADTPFDGLVFGRHAHVAGAERIGQYRHHHVDQGGVAHAGAGAHRRGQVAPGRHDFDATAQADFGIAKQDVLGNVDDGLHGGSAQAVAGHHGRFHGHAGADGDAPWDVGETEATGNDVADDGVGGLLGIHPGTHKRFLGDQTAQFFRRQPAQRATKAANRRSYGTECYNFFGHDKPFLKMKAAAILRPPENRYYPRTGGTYGSVSPSSQSRNSTTGVWKISCSVE